MESLTKLSVKYINETKALNTHRSWHFGIQFDVSL